MPTVHEIAKELWDCAYTTFEKRPGDGFRTGFATKQSVNDVQYRMMQHIASLREQHTRDENGKILNDILGDVLLSEANGWMTHETSNRMQNLLEQLRTL